MKRIFLAIKITPSKKLNDLFQSLHSELISEKIKWVDSNNLHLTLKFFGETEEIKIDEISFFIRNIISSTASFSFDISNLGIFGSNYQPKIVWLGINNSKALINLANTLLNNLKTIGFERDRQNFVPHLTLGRINYLTDKELFNKIIKNNNISNIQTVTVTEIFLFESILRKEGPMYKLIRSFKLNS
ncbi:MAG: RNA 2',3'-cyclic phosphodiesterase [Bacteroidetes bacterium]|nr:RNA 2',3'-cyclic phosphodiesterase [Bacteroidota bacterium]